MNKSVLKFAILSIIFTLALSVNYLFAAWTGPTQAPPGGNTPTPVNISSTAQTKTGAFIAGGLRSLTDLYVDGNVGIGTTEPLQKLDVAGGIKVGNTSSCVNGTIRYTNGDFHGCKEGSWVSLTGVGGDDGVVSPDYTDCINAGGSWIDAQGICYIPGSSCPAGWTQQSSYTSTSPNFCTYTGIYQYCPETQSWESCTTGGHFRTDTGVETCSYSGSQYGNEFGNCWQHDYRTCTATQTEIGCTKD